MDQVGELNIKLRADGVNLKGDISKATEQAGKDGASSFKKGFSSGLQGLGEIIAGAGITAGIAALAKGVITLAGNLQQARVAFSTMLGSAGKAEVLLKDLAKFASNTPFELTGLVESSKRLLAFGFGAKEVIPTLDALGNIAAGVGTEKLPFLITALGQVRAKTILSGEELRQFTETGVPLIGELAKVTGFGVAEIVGRTKDLGITYDQVTQALTNLGSEGGKFGGLMQAQSLTFQGSVSNLKDSLGQLGSQIGEVFLGPLTSLTTFVTGIVNSFREWSAENPILSNTIISLVGGITLLVGAILGLASAMGVLSFISVGLTGVLASLGVSVAGGLGVALLSVLGPISLVIGGVTLLYLAYKKNFLGIGTALDNFASQTRIIFNTIRILFSQVLGYITTFTNSIRSYIRSRSPMFVDSIKNIVASFGGMKGIGDQIRKRLDIAFTIATFGMNKIVGMLARKLGEVTGITNAINSAYNQAQSEARSLQTLENFRTGNLSGEKRQSINLTREQVFGYPQDILPPIGGGSIGGGGGGGGSKSDSEAKQAEHEAEKQRIEEIRTKSKFAIDEIIKKVKERRDVIKEAGKAIDEIQKQEQESIDKTNKQLEKSTTDIEKIRDKIKGISEDIKGVNAEISGLNSKTGADLASRFIDVQAEIQRLSSEGSNGDKLGKLQQELDFIKANTTDAQRSEAERQAGLSTAQKILESRDKELLVLEAKKLRLEEERKAQEIALQGEITIRAQLEQQKIQELATLTEITNAKIALEQKYTAILVTEVDKQKSVVKSFLDLLNAKRASKVDVVGGIDGARADGGPVRGGGTYLVGERGPEIFTPRLSGHIIPNHQMNNQTINKNRSINVNVNAPQNQPLNGYMLERDLKWALSGLRF